MNEQNYEYQLQALEEFRRFLMEFVEELTTEMSQYRGQADNLRESGLTIQLTNNYLENYQYRIMQSLGRVVDNILKIHIPFINKNIEAVERAMGAARRVNSLETGFSHNIFKENMKTNWGFEAPTNINSNIVNMRTDLPTNNSKIGESFESMTKTPEAILPLSGDLLLADGGNKPLDSAQESVNPKTDTYGYDLLASEKNDPFINSLINFPQGPINQGTDFLPRTKTPKIMLYDYNPLADGGNKPLDSAQESVNPKTDTYGYDLLASEKNDPFINSLINFPQGPINQGTDFLPRTKTPKIMLYDYNPLADGGNKPLDSAQESVNPKTDTYGYDLLASEKNDPFINSLINFPQGHINQGTNFLHTTKTSEVMPPPIGSNLLGDGVSKPLINLDKVKIIGRVQLNDGSFIEILNNGWHVHYVDAEGSDKIVSIKDKTGKHIPLSTFNPGITPSHIKGYKEFPDTNWNLVREKKNFFKELYLSGAYVSNYSDGRASNSLMNFPQSPINQGTDFLPRTKTPKIMLYDYNPLADGGNDPFINSSINFPQSPINQGTDSLPVAKTPEIMPPSVESNLLAGGVSKPIVTDSLPIAKTPEIMPPSVESNLLAGGVSKPIVTDSLPIAKTPEIMPPSVESNLLAGGVSKPIVTDLKGPLL